MSTDAIIDFLATNPLFIVFCSIIGLVGFVLGIIFYYKGKRVKKLSYIIRNFAVIDDSIAQIEGLGVTFNGLNVKSLSVSRFGFWNEGNETINGTDIAQNDQLRISAVKGVEILDFKVISHTKLANNFALEYLLDSKGIGIEFDYLDPNDGILLQVYHTGTEKNDIYLGGAIKGISKFENQFDYNWDVTKSSVFAPKPITFSTFLKNALPFTYLSICAYTYSLASNKINDVLNIIIYSGFAIAILGFFLLMFLSLFMKKPKGFKLLEQDE